MVTNLDRWSDNAYIACHIEVTEARIEILFDSIWLSNQSTNKKIAIGRISAEVDPEASYSFNLQIRYSTKQYSSYYVYNI
jgi:hypothetical protein